MSEQRLILGDCLDVFRGVRGLGAIVTDPPAGIGFMGRSWDKDRGGRSAWIAYWAERFAVAREACEPDSVALVWALPRTQHWTATALEDGGWFVRDVITHHFGQGWPKNKAHLKPASEAWILAVKGRPALDIDACRVGRVNGEAGTRCSFYPERCQGHGSSNALNGPTVHAWPPTSSAGSWPTNVVLSHAEACGAVCDPSCPIAEMDEQSGILVSNGVQRPVIRGLGYGGGAGSVLDVRPIDIGGASRFFPRFGYYGKAPGAERHAGCENLYWRADKKDPFGFVQVTREEWEALGGEGYSGGLTAGKDNRPGRALPADTARGNVHPTVKRLALMRWLHALTGAKRIGDLCGGSGSGMVAAYLDGIEWLGAELCPQAITIAEARLAWWRALTPQARARFCAEDEMPAAAAPLEGQAALFGVL